MANGPTPMRRLITKLQSLDIANITERLKYSELPDRHIRLFGLNPGKKGDPVTGFILQNNLDSLDQANWAFQALSYTWGESAEAVDIAVADTVNEHIGMLRITKSLFDILTTFRDGEGALGIWVDQICIDQNNQREKESQILFLRLIYERSSRVLSWFDSGGKRNDLGMNMLNRGDWVRTPDFNEAFNGALKQLGMEPTLENRKLAFDAINAIFSQRYWNRTWIWQESTAQPTRTLLSWEKNIVDFRSFLNFAVRFKEQFLSNTGLDEGWDTSPILTKTRFLDFWNVRQSGVKQPLSALLFDLREAEVTDPRDKIFAVVPFSDDNTEDLQPDYNMSALQVYTKFMLWHIRKYQSLDVLSYCRGERSMFAIDAFHAGRMTTAVGAVNDFTGGQQEPSQQGFIYGPTWVPDWRSQYTPREKGDSWGYDIWPLPKTDNFFNLTGEPLFRACGPHPLEFKFDLKEVNEGIQGITVKGVKVATVQHRADQSADSVQFLAEEKWYRSFQERRPSNWQHSGDLLFKRTIHADISPFYSNDDVLVHYKRASSPDKDFLWPFHNVTGDIMLEMGILKQITAVRVTFQTKGAPGKPDGLYGLGPRWMVPGDEIWILQGASVPCVLRRQKLSQSVKVESRDLNLHTGIIGRAVREVEDTFTFYVGECFILGLMDGEVLDLMKLEDDDPRRAEVPELEREFHEITLH